jgi:Skp family chaperone for outer membrane proteins
MQELRAYIKDAVSAALTQPQPRNAPSTVPATPALHTQQIKAHIDGAVASAVSETKSVLQRRLEEHSFQRAEQLQLMEDFLSSKSDELQSQLSQVLQAVQQLSEKIDGDVALKAQLSKW